MNTQPTHFKDLFAQLGLPADNDSISRFISQHASLDSTIRLPDAPFWSQSQANFLREQLLADADWAEWIDQLDNALRASRK